MKTKILNAQWVPWADDDPWIQNATVIGRVRIALVGGGVIHALLLQHDDQSGRADDVRQRAVYLNRELNRFELCEVTG